LEKKGHGNPRVYTCIHAYAYAHSSYAYACSMHVHAYTLDQKLYKESIFYIKLSLE